MSDLKWPIEPLLGEIKRRNVACASKVLRVNGTTWDLVNARGWVSDKQADKYAARLGLHPAEVWQDWFSIPLQEEMDFA